MEQLSIRELGQIAHADVALGDMTVLVGPQASGKSILLQTVKLVLDYGDITKTIKQYGYDWQRNRDDFLSLYYGEGMQGIWRDDTRIQVDGERFDLDHSLSQRGRKRQESLFLIPAQRVLTLRNGWPRSFMDFETGDPYVVRQFSEKLRQLMEAGLGRGKAPIFPQVGRMKAGIRSVIDDSIFGGIEVRLDTRAMRKRIILQVGEQSLPFMTWSAGQREFVPLLLGLYWLMPSTRASTRQGIEWVVVEEPEAGLHPQAVTSVLVTLLELIHRGYRVIVSTHSTQVVEMMWAIRVLSESSASPESLLKLLGLQRQSGWIAWAREIMTQKVFRTFFFERSGHAVTAKDISTLDPFDMDEAISDWGGLTSFSTRVSEVISNAVREAA